MKDHEIRELVNQLRDVAIKYHGAGQLREQIARTVRAAILNQAQQPATDNTAQQFEALAVVKHYTGNTYPTLKFAQDEWCVCGDRDDAQELADAINALATSQDKPTAAPIIPDSLHPDTADLVIRFATALAEKLHRAEQKYGHANGWMATGWYNECLQQLWDHIEKGDPRDVAAYCAFMWHHGWVTTDYDRGVPQALATSTKCKRCDGEGWVADEMGITQCGCGATTSAGKVKS